MSKLVSVLLKVFKYFYYSSLRVSLLGIFSVVVVFGLAVVFQQSTLFFKYAVLSEVESFLVGSVIIIVIALSLVIFYLVGRKSWLFSSLLAVEFSLALSNVVDSSNFGTFLMSMIVFSYGLFVLSNIKLFKRVMPSWVSHYEGG